MSRLREPSTWAGFSGALLSLAEGAPVGKLQITLRAAAGLAACVAVYLKEGR